MDWLENDQHVSSRNSSVGSWRMEECIPPTLHPFRGGDSSPSSGDCLPLLNVLLDEYRHLHLHIPSGMVVVPSFETMLEWHGILFVKEGWFKGGVFKFHMAIPVDYPGSPPVVIFDSRVFHSLVDQSTGHLDLSPAFPTWTPGRDYIVLVLSFLKKVFYKKELNAYFSHLPRADFVARCEDCVAESLRLMYISVPDSPLVFEPWKRARVRSLLSDESMLVGLSARGLDAGPSAFEIIQDSLQHVPKTLPLEIQTEAFMAWLTEDFIPNQDPVEDGFVVRGETN